MLRSSATGFHTLRDAVSSTTRPHYLEFLLYGPFHRLEGRGQTQGVSTVRAQLLSGEVWGRPSRYSGGVPLVQAHRGPLPDDATGIEFLAFAIPDKRYGAPEWRSPARGPDGVRLVWLEADSHLGDLVKMRVAITRVTQALG